MSISRKKRYLVFERDKFTCQYCGRRPPTVILEVDHIIPKSKGGTDDISNLITSCRDCNRGKSSIIPIEKLREIKRLEKERQRQREAYNRFIQQQRKELERDVKELLALWVELCNEQFILNEKGISSLFYLLRHFTKEEIKVAMHIASDKIQIDKDPKKDIEVRFKYMCGILNNWKKQKENPMLYELIQYWRRKSHKQKRGVGFYKEECLIKALKKYTIEEIKQAMDLALSEKRDNYFRALCNILQIKY